MSASSRQTDREVGVGVDSGSILAVCRAPQYNRRAVVARRCSLRGVKYQRANCDRCATIWAKIFGLPAMMSPLYR